MDESQFSRALQSVGLTCFVKYYGDFSSSTVSREDMAERLKREENYTDNSCISRTVHARRIIKAGLAKRAFKAIASSNSPRVTDEIKELAERWLQSNNT